MQQNAIGLFIVLLLFLSGGKGLIKRRSNNERNTLLNSVAPQQVDIVSIQNSGKGVKSSFSTDSGPAWKFQRLSNNNMEMAVELVSIIEFEESDGPSGFDGTDTIISRMPLYSSSWRTITESKGVSNSIMYYLYDTSLENGNSSLVQIETGLSDIRGWVSPANKTLSPAAWASTISINGYPLKSLSRSHLALKVLLAVNGLQSPQIRDNIPPVEADSIESQDDILFQTNTSGVDPNDLSYFEWNHEGTEIGGLFPELDSILLDIKTKQRTVEVIHSGILDSANDLDPMNTSDLPEKYDSVYFMYFSFMVGQPKNILWKTFAGLDELAVQSSTNVVVPWTPLFYALLYLFVS